MEPNELHRLRSILGIRIIRDVVITDQRLSSRFCPPKCPTEVYFAWKVSTHEFLHRGDDFINAILTVPYEYNV